VSNRAVRQRRAMAHRVMTMSSQSGGDASDRSYLYVAEFLHRVLNEYTCAISLTTRLAARSSHEETKAALAQITNCLRGLAAAHQILRPPLTAALADLSTNLTQLCRAMTSFELVERGIELHLAIAEPVLLDAKRCWQAELIISELITNALRHAFPSRGGRISIAVEAGSGQVICRVSDDGSPATSLKRGLGSKLIDALAADLDGYVERIHNASGTTVTLLFPQDPDERSIVAIPTVKCGAID
jgi:two-component sensor histidine kinase